MRLDEAIKSGKPIRRRDRATWNRSDKNYICDPSKDQWIDPTFYLEIVGVTKDDLLSDQWEIEDEVPTITSEQFKQFWNAYKAELLLKSAELYDETFKRAARQLIEEAEKGE